MLPTTFGPGPKSAALGRILTYEARMHKRFGAVREQRYQRFFTYYAGTNLPPNNVEQPLGINYVKEICDKHTGYFWGEASDGLLGWKVKPRDKRATPEDATSIAMRVFLDQFLEDNYADTLLYDASLDASVYGDTVLRVSWDALECRPRLTKILPEWFHCRWDPADYNRLIEVIVAYPIARDDAELRYGTGGNTAFLSTIPHVELSPGFCMYWEHWTAFSHRLWIDDIPVVDEPNPFLWTDDSGTVYPGIIPYLHIPNMRIGGEFYGFSDVESVLLIQDEINRRMADAGDIVNNHAHPIVLLQKYQGDIEDLPVGPDAVWDLGMNGEATILEAKGNSLAAEHLQTLFTVLLDTASLPEIAFGRQSKSNGRAQSSATAIQLILSPAVNRARRKRVQWTTSLSLLAKMAIFVAALHAPESLGFALRDLGQYQLRPVFGPILPKDQLQKVNENVALYINGLRSPKRALEDLGEEDIGQQLTDIQADQKLRAALQIQLGGKNSDRGQGGSPGSGGPSAKMKPGAPVPDTNNSGDTNPALKSFQGS